MYLNIKYDSDIIEFLNNEENKQDVMKKALRDYMKKKKKQLQSVDDSV